MPNAAKMAPVRTPGPTAQYINKQLHTEPISFLFHGFFWFFVLTIACPLTGVYLFLKTLINTFQYMYSLHLYLFYGSDRSDSSQIIAKKSEKILAVFITGCDTGFGKDLAFALADRGFVVFAGCLTEQGMSQYTEDDKNRTSMDKNIIPIKVNVTNENDVLRAAEIVSKWLNTRNNSDSLSPPKVLHAVVNNAGIGSFGYIDFLDASFYQKDMEVNFYGMIQTTKAFLPILKRQSCSGMHGNARVINMVSMAGLVTSPGLSSYHSSKFAAEAFSSCLRMELKGAFDIDVITVNPSYHQTPIIENLDEKIDYTWNNASSEKKKEYGIEYFVSRKNQYVNMMLSSTWDPENVRYELIACVEDLEPSPQRIVGLDAKTILLLLKMIPVWMQAKMDNLIQSLCHPLPAKMANHI